MMTVPCLFPLGGMTVTVLDAVKEPVSVNSTVEVTKAVGSAM